ICGAPKAIAIPRIAPMHQPQEIRFAMAIAPSTMTRMIAIGVSHARMFACSDVAPVRNGEACANACPGDKSGSSEHSAQRWRRRMQVRVRSESFSKRALLGLNSISEDSLAYD